mmetsp:Transcript_98434/g.273822  ORF Transcript_98434/g.273822 Transcript_98434/m.273822 type:complete len:208 (-) Transcript_98434:313-936(-)
MEQVALTLPKDLAQVLVVHGAEVRLGAALAHELEDLRGRGVGLAPHAELSGGLQLPAARLEGPADGVGLVGVDLVLRHLAGVLAQLLVVLAQSLAQPLELLGPLVLPAEVKGVASCFVVDVLEARVGLQDVEQDLVSVPQESEERVRVAVLALLPGVLRLNGPEQDRLRRLHLVEVPQPGHLQVLLLLGLVHLLLRSLAEVLHDLLQ